MTLEIGDIVKYKNPCLDSDVGEFTVVRVDNCKIGKPCFIENHLYRRMAPSDVLVRVKNSSLTPDQLKIRELEQRIEVLERKLGVTL